MVIKHISHNGQLIVKTAKTTEEIEALRDIWNAMHPGPEADIDYYLALVNSLKEILRPHVILLERQGEPVTMLVAYIEYRRPKLKVINQAFLPSVRCLTIILGGVLGHCSHSNSDILISELYKALKFREADIISFSEIPTDSPIFKLSRTKPSVFCRDFFPNIDRHFKMALPSSIDQIMRGKARKRNKSLWRKLADDFDDNVQVKKTREIKNVERFCNELEAVSKKTYQHASGGGFICNSKSVALLSSLSTHGCLRAYVLYIQNIPCAYWIGYIHKDSFYSFPIGGTGYDPSYRKYGIGNLLMWRMIEDLCLEANVQYLDFGFMDTPYKRKICELSWEEANFYIFQPSLKGFIINSWRVTSSLYRRARDRIFLSLKLEEKWKKLRNRST
jgi:hypothetical protein